MQTLKNILAFLEGKRTYIAGLVSVVLGVYLNNVDLIMLGLVAMGLRAAIK